MPAMTAHPPAQTLPASSELEPRLQAALTLARSLGASAAESYLGVSRGLSVAVRQGEVESVQFQRDRDLSVTVFFGNRTGSASTTSSSRARVFWLVMICPPWASLHRRAQRLFTLPMAA